ncbi:hepatic leukemia factor-like isoform X1 [Saccostrea cucullata]|uniref:hepatic leukemia factor-like isoform X1 n=1 Tax=Saccostrea cuccullata TaxID=36930 RepID=UPI002ED1037D
MADGGFCNFSPGVDGSVLSQMYHERAAAQNFDESREKPHGPGFYQDQYSTVEEMAASTIQAMSNQNRQSNALGTHIATTAAAGLFEPHLHSSMNYALKPEKGLPPTPPGSPSEATPSQQQLTKPVPMRRRSEKSVSQTRLTMSNSYETSVFEHSAALYGHAAAAASASSPTLARALAAVQQTQKRPRSEKKPIPNEQKDGKYFERRKRNNLAAKKSRDARKAREDEIAIRASFLEKENAILRAQVGTLREEANSLKQLLLQKRARP